jgi:hypothetical protein
MSDILDIERQREHNRRNGRSLMERIPDSEPIMSEREMEVEDEIPGTDDEEEQGISAGEEEETERQWVKQGETEQEEKEEEQGEEEEQEVEEEELGEEEAEEDGVEDDDEYDITIMQDSLLHDVALRDCRCTPFAKELARQISELPKEMRYQGSWKLLERVRALGTGHFCFNHLRYLASKGFSMLNSKGGITQRQLVKRLK